MGVSGKSSDMRDVIAAMKEGDHDATLAYEMYVNRIQKHIGQYLAVLNLSLIHISIEDPVEIKQDDMLQLQLNEAIGLTYENLIKLSLRHRPDLLIIGEIRDSETARAVVRASLTGATVFLSLIHIFS